MDFAQLNRADKKKLLEHFLQEEPSLLKDVLLEILQEQDIIPSQEYLERQKKLEAIIEGTFDKYEEVFKRLA